MSLLAGIYQENLSEIRIEFLKYHQIAMRGSRHKRKIHNNTIQYTQSLTYP